MKTEDMLVLGAVGVGAYFLFSQKQNIDNTFSGIGAGLSSAGETVEQVGGTLEDTSKFIRRNVNTVETYATQIIEIPKKIIEGSASIIKNNGDMNKYIASQPIVLNAVQGTRKNLSLAASRGQTELPLIKKDTTTGKITTTMVSNPMSNGLKTLVNKVVSTANKIIIPTTKTTPSLVVKTKKSQSLKK